MNFKKNKKILFLFSIIIILLLLGIYFLNTYEKNNKTNISLEENIKDKNIDWNSYEETSLTLTESITITKGGIYNLTGTISNGLITIETTDNVKLILNGVNISNNSGPAIYIKKANMTVISLSEETDNYLSDGSNYTDYDDDVEGAIYSKDDLILEGTGTLNITSSKGDAIVSKDNIKINSGTYNITSTLDGIRGKDSVYITSGVFNIDAGGDGIKSTNTSSSAKGYVTILGGTFNITATLDGIQAETNLTIKSGDFTIKTGGTSSNTTKKTYYTNEKSAKGIVAGTLLTIENGTFNLNTYDDSLHSNGNITINSGEYYISSGDDAIHADDTLTINNGTIEVTKSYEGLEAETIVLNAGTINLEASDDGINAAGGADSSANNRPNHQEKYSKSSLTINGGTITVNATGDGLDSNGNIYVNGGTIIVSGPTSNGDGALDYDGTFEITDGELLAYGSSGMAQGISNTSTQYGFLINLSTTYQSSSKITLVDSDGNEIFTHTTNKLFSSIVYSSPKLQEGGTYTLKINDKIIESFTLNSISSTYGNSNRFDRH